MKTERYFSVDIESSGPIPGKYSMLAIGACVVGSPDQNFYVELKPISNDFVPDAMKVSGFDFETLNQTGQDPMDAMKKFRHWIETASGDCKPVFVGFNGCYDWQFVNWYLESFAGGNPFGFGGIDIKSYFMGLEWASVVEDDLQPAPIAISARLTAKSQCSRRCTSSGFDFRKVNAQPSEK